MVEVIIKGRETRDKGMDIAKIDAGVVLRKEGGIFLQISNMKLSKKLKRLFDTQNKKEENIKERVGTMRLTPAGLKKLANSIINLRKMNPEHTGPFDTKLVEMPIWQGQDGGLYMQLSKGQGFIDIITKDDDLMEIEG